MHLIVSKLYFISGFFLIKYLSTKLCFMFQVEDSKQFPCDVCRNICKSRDGLTRNQRSQHSAEQSESSTAIPEAMQIISTENVKELIGNIGQHLTDKKLYNKQDIVDVLTLVPSESFVKFLKCILSKFQRQKNDNKLFQQF